MTPEIERRDAGQRADYAIAMGWVAGIVVSGGVLILLGKMIAGLLTQ